MCKLSVSIKYEHDEKWYEDYSLNAGMNTKALFHLVWNKDTKYNTSQLTIKHVLLMPIIFVYPVNLFVENT